MDPALLDVLRCPETGRSLRLESQEERDGHVYSGWCISEGTGRRFPIRRAILRFVPENNYADNFGMQWTLFRKTQLDSHSGLPISANRFYSSTRWKPEELRGQWVLDAGCGAGRFAEVALEAGAKVLAVDYSTAVEACYENLHHHSNLHVIQADIYHLPLRPRFFPFVYCLGVLQHTPDVAQAFAALPPTLSKGGRLVVDVYLRSALRRLLPRCWIRPLTRRIPRQRLFHILERLVPTLFWVSCLAQRVPLAGPLLQRLVPVVNYTGTYPLRAEQHLEWALLDTFDWLAPTYDQPQTAVTLRRWLQQAGLTDVEVEKIGHLVGRGTKSRR